MISFKMLPRFLPASLRGWSYVEVADDNAGQQRVESPPAEELKVVVDAAPSGTIHGNRCAKPDKTPDDVRAIYDEFITDAINSNKHL